MKSGKLFIEIPQGSYCTRTLLYLVQKQERFSYLHFNSALDLKACNDGTDIDVSFEKPMKLSLLFQIYFNKPGKCFSQMTNSRSFSALTDPS